jgi:DNA-binding Lrp family transcriptional regulator
MSAASSWRSIARCRIAAIWAELAERIEQPAQGKPGCQWSEASGPPEPSSPGTAGAVAADTQFRDWAARLPETVGVFVVSGSEDFLLHIAVADNQQLYAFVIDKLTERPEVADVRTSVIYEHLRNHAVGPAAQP